MKIEIQSRLRQSSGVFAALAGIVALGLLFKPATVEGAAPPSAGPAKPGGGAYSLLQRKGVSVPAIAGLGKALFFDARLSASGKLACATCHDPSHAYGPPNGLSVQLGGELGKLAGTRAAPSIRYVQNVPPFTEHFHDGEDDSEDQGPAGGHTWDGRAGTVHDQARLPLFSPLEMANRSPAEAVAKLRAAGYGERMKVVFGADVAADKGKMLDATLLALEVFQQTPAEFFPYTSKYDAVLRGQAKLTPREARGLALFNDENKGNCASCHPSGMQEGAFPAFSDWGFIALGVPRNKALPVNRDNGYFDLGLCGPERKDFAGNPAYCGLFRTPSLRNVAERKAFFHNGVMHSLEDVLAFYATRDSQPQRWYPHDGKGNARKFDDLPEQYRENVNMEPPFGRKPGQAPALSKAEIGDMVAFLKTLSDGYVAPKK